MILGFSVHIANPRRRAITCWSKMIRMNMAFPLNAIWRPQLRGINIIPSLGYWSNLKTLTLPMMVGSTVSIPRHRSDPLILCTKVYWYRSPMIILKYLQYNIYMPRTANYPVTSIDVPGRYDNRCTMTTYIFKDICCCIIKQINKIFFLFITLINIIPI